MPAPRNITDGLECVLSVFFSNARHNIRAAFLLCDELVEVTCREKAKQRIRNLGKIGFFDLLNHAAVGLTPASNPLGESLLKNHEARNDMQHNNAAATVDSQHCADAIMDAVQAMDHCFPNASSDLPHMLKVAVRLVRLFSSHGEPSKRLPFSAEMLNHSWRSGKRSPRMNEAIFLPGDRSNWGAVVMAEYVQVEVLLRNSNFTCLGAGHRFY